MLKRAEKIEKNAQKIFENYQNLAQKPDFFPKISSEPLKFANILKDIFFHSKEIFDKKLNEYFLINNRSNMRIELYKKYLCIDSKIYKQYQFVEFAQEMILKYLELGENDGKQSSI